MEVALADVRTNRARRLTAGTPTRAAALGLVLALSAVACGSAGASSTSPAVYHVAAQRFRFGGMPTRIPPGLFDVTFTNHEAFPFQHEMVLISLQVGQTSSDVINDAKTKGSDSEDDWLHWGEIPDVQTGATKVGVFDLPSGTYALACWQTGIPGGGTGEVHAARGMVFQFTVASP